MSIVYLLAAGLLAGQITEPGVYDVADWVQPARDCASGTCDLKQPIEDVLADCDSTYAGSDRGCFIQLPAGDYTLSDTISLCRSHTISGRGSGFPGAMTKITTSKTAFHFRSYGDCAQANLPGTGGGHLTDVALFSSEPSPSSPIFGVFAESGVVVERAYVNGFTQGVRISADHTRTPASNANRWRVHETMVVLCEHAGIYVDGGDSNAGGAQQSAFSSNCREASTWSSALGDCANVIDSSFLGNTWIAATTASAKDVSTQVAYPGFLFEGPNQQSVCVGCYAETDQPTSQLAPNSMAVGGTSAWQGGRYLQGWASNGLVVDNRLDGNNAVSLQLGEATGVGGAYAEYTWVGGSAPAGSGLYPLRMKFHAGTSAWQMDVANANSLAAYRISAKDNGPVGDRGEMAILRWANYCDYACDPACQACLP